MKSLSLSVYHLNVSLSWGSNHTSSERAVTELPADKFFFLNFFLQIALFTHVYGAALGSIRVHLHFGLPHSHFLQQIELLFLHCRGILEV